MTSNRLLSRNILAAITLMPLGLIAYLTFSFLIPSLKDPESKIYYSKIGYPALQRAKGEPITVQTIAAEFKQIGVGISAPGETLALDKVDIKSQLRAPVESVYVVEGDQVKKGQALIQLQKDLFENGVLAAEIEVMKAKRLLTSAKASSEINIKRFKGDQNDAAAREKIAEERLDNFQRLHEQGAVSKFQLSNFEEAYINRSQEARRISDGLDLAKQDKDIQIAEAKLSLRMSEIKLKNARYDLEHTLIKAPVDGLVSYVQMNDGEVADKTTTIITLNSDVAFKAYIDQSQINAISVGDEAQIRLVAYPGKVFAGRVVRINRTVETQAVMPQKVDINRQFTYSAWVRIKGLAPAPGLQGFVQLKPYETRLVIPESAVNHLSGGEGMVMVASHGRAELRKVRLGRLNGNQREVISGLHQGERVVLSPKALEPGDRINYSVSDI
jgi:HlyD family secretion protein